MAKKRSVVEITPFYRDQQKIFWHGSHVGYCGTKPGMPINFLAGKNCLLDDQERADCLQAVIDLVGEVKLTKQTKRYFDVLGERSGGSAQGPDAQASADDGQ